MANYPSNLPPGVCDDDYDPPYDRERDPDSSLDWPVRYEDDDA